INIKRQPMVRAAALQRVQGIFARISDWLERSGCNRACRSRGDSDHRPSGNVSESAVRNRDVNRDHPRARRPFRPSTIANDSGTAREKSRRTIRDYFPKTENDLTRSITIHAWDRPSRAYRPPHLTETHWDWRSSATSSD